MAVRSVTVGERVSLYFTERDYARRGRPYYEVQHLGTVIDFDERGIYIALDEPSNGLDTCYATYAEVNHAGRSEATA